MKNPFQKNKAPTVQTIRLNGSSVELLPLKLSEVVEVFFLLSPYIKTIQKIKDDYKSESSIETFQFVTETLLSELDRKVVVEILSIILHKPYVFVSDISISEIATYIFDIIMVNKLLEYYALFDKLGVFE